MENKASYTFQEIKQKLVNYCVYQDRCHSEVEQKMREFLLAPPWGACPHEIAEWGWWSRRPGDINRIVF